MYKLQSVYRHCVFIIRQQILAKYNRSVGSWTLEHPVCIFKGRPMHRFAIRSSGNGRSLRLCEVPREGRAKDTKQSGKAAAAKAPASHSENSFWTRNLGKTLVLNWSKLVIANMIEHEMGIYACIHNIYIYLSMYICNTVKVNHKRLIVFQQVTRAQSNKFKMDRMNIHASFQRNARVQNNNCPVDWDFRSKMKLPTG